MTKKEKEKTFLKSLDIDLTCFARINSKCILGLNIKLLENNIREKVDDFGFGNDVLDPTRKAQSIKKKKIDKSEIIKSKKKKKLLCERHCEKNKKP